MKKLTVYTNFRRAMEGLADDEKGRLFDAMLLFAETGEEPSFSGNERFVWGSVLNMFDAINAFNEKQRVNGVKGGKPKKTQTNPDKPKQTQTNPTEPSGTQTKPKIKENKIKENNNTPTEYIEPTAFEIAMEEFKQFRKSIKSPLNELSEKKIRNELERLSNGDELTKIQIIDQSIRNGWKGVFALKDRQVRNYAEHKASNFDHLLTNLDEV